MFFVLDCGTDMDESVICSHSSVAAKTAGIDNKKLVTIMNIIMNFVKFIPISLPPEKLFWDTLKIFLFFAAVQKVPLVCIIKSYLKILWNFQSPELNK
jgi:hypothetical protein